MDLKVTSLVLLGVLFATTSGCAVFTEEKVVMFDDIDANADGCISKSEAVTRPTLSDNFSKADTDKSGTVCVDEYTTWHNKGRMEKEEVEIPEVGAAPVK